MKQIINKIICKINGHENMLKSMKRVNTKKDGLVAIPGFNGYCSRCGKTGLTKTL